jgi:hypothetical protein
MDSKPFYNLRERAIKSMNPHEKACFILRVLEARDVYVTVNEKYIVDGEGNKTDRVNDLTKHFKQKHLTNIKEGDRIECKVCQMSLQRKMHLQNHAESIHGTVS